MKLVQIKNQFILCIHTQHIQSICIAFITWKSSLINFNIFYFIILFIYTIHKVGWLQPTKPKTTRRTRAFNKSLFDTFGLNLPYHTYAYIQWFQTLTGIKHHMLPSTPQPNTPDKVTDIYIFPNHKIGYGCRTNNTHMSYS